MSQPLTLRTHVDPAHGFLEVPAPILRTLELTPKDFTKYSYVSSLGTMYLEEDCDWPKFLLVLKDKLGLDVVYQERHYERGAPCRKLQRNTEGEYTPFGG